MWDFKLKRTRVIFISSLIWVVVLFLINQFWIYTSLLWLSPVLIYWTSPIFIKWIVPFFYKRIKLIISWVAKGK
jgi:hypothetical protein